MLQLLVSVCKVRTQDPENFDEEVKSLVTAWNSSSATQQQDAPSKDFQPVVSKVVVG